MVITNTDQNFTHNNHNDAIGIIYIDYLECYVYTQQLYSHSMTS